MEVVLWLVRELVLVWMWYDCSVFRFGVFAGSVGHGLGDVRIWTRALPACLALVIVDNMILLFKIEKYKKSIYVIIDV